MSKLTIPIRPCEVTSVHFRLGGCPLVEVKVPPIVVGQDDDVEVVQASVTTDRVTFQYAVEWFER
jgi:hypothetical protein